MPRLRKFKVLLATSIFLLAVAAATISITILQRQDTLQRVGRYNIAWFASQAVVEALRLQERIATFGLNNGMVDADEVALRWDVLQSRATLLEDGEFKDFVQQHPDHLAVLAELHDRLGRLEPIIAAIERPGMVAQALEILAPLPAKLSRVAAAANQEGGVRVAEDQRQLLLLHWIFSGLAALLVACGFVLIGLLTGQYRWVASAHRQLSRMTDQLRSARDAAEAGSEAKSRFLASMSHELRTPLNAIIGFSEVIARELFGPVGSERYRNYAHDILRSGKHMHELVGDILLMARLDAGHHELKPRRLDPGPVVHEAVEILKGTEMARGRTVLMGGAERPWPAVRADERALRQMALNLLSNALKFSSPETAVAVECKPEPDGGVRLTVTDRGIGMTPAQVALAVQPFQQVDNPAARRFEGAGLGLAIVKAMAEQHGGRLEIDSRPGQGTRVSILFPREGAAEPAAELRLAG